jgi:hypothetical protein
VSLLDTGELYRRYQEVVHEGCRLGRNLWLDARSLAYMVENAIAEMVQPVRSVTWDRKISILDQGSLGSCTGNAGTGALGTEPYWSRIGADQLELDEEYAVLLYSDATLVDAWPGQWPTEDTGSSGLAICKVLKRRGTIRGYRWARSPHGLLHLLQAGPALLGMPWYEAFFDPDVAGFIDTDPTWPSSGVAGGHELELVGVEVDSRDVYSSVVTFANSWGMWGDAGYGRMRLRTYEQLSGCDLKQYLA